MDIDAFLAAHSDNDDNGGWEREAFDNDTTKMIQERHKREFRNFLEEHAKHLVNIEDALDDSLGSNWDFFKEPISLKLSSFESTSILDLVTTDNKVLTKFVAVFATLCNEIALLQEEAQNEYFSALLMYGDSTVQLPLEEGDVQLMFGKLVSLLQRVSIFVDRVNQVVKNALQQLAMMYIGQQQSNTKTTSVLLTTVFRYIGNILATLATLQEIVSSNETLQNHMNQYRRMLRAVRAKPELFNFTSEQLQPFDRLFSRLKGQLFDQVIFQSCIEQNFDDSTVSVSANNILKNYFVKSMTEQLEYYDKILATQADLNHRQEFFGLCCQLILFSSIFQTMSKPLARTFWDVRKKVPAIFMYGTVIISPGEFVLRKIPAIEGVLEKKGLSDLSQRTAELKTLDSTIVAKTAALYHQACVWMASMDSDFHPMTNQSQQRRMQFKFIRQVEYFSDLCLPDFSFGEDAQGIFLAFELRHLATTFINLHSLLGVPVTTSNVRAFFRIVELLKAIELTYFRKSIFVVNLSQLHTQGNIITLLKEMQNIQQSLQRAK
eukprot:gene9157-10362_t